MAKQTANRRAPQGARQTAPTVSHGEQVSAGDFLFEALATASADPAAPGQAPSTIKLAPAGRVQTRDGRAFEFDPAMLVARFEKDAVDIPVDLEHSLSSFLGDKGRGAVGWISRLEAREDGLYGEVTWLAPGLEALAARTHRYVSPTFRHDAFGKATWLHSAALVAAPALSMPALASAVATGHPDHDDQENDPMNAETFARLAALAGLSSAVTVEEAAMLAALEAKMAEGVAAAETLATLRTEHEALQASVRKGRVDAMLGAALSAKKIFPAERERFERLAATDEGLAEVEALLEAMPARLSASNLDGAPGAQPGDDAPMTAQQIAEKASALQAELSAKGVEIDIATAVGRIMNRPA